MKVKLNVLDKKLQVVSIDYSLGEIDRVLTVDDLGIYQSYHNEKTTNYNSNSLPIKMEEALEFPEQEQRIVDERNELIEHLEELIVREKEKITAIAIDAMEGEADGLPFSELPLSDAQKEYKLTEQYMLGIVDAVEEVKAFTEGWYADDKTTTATATEKHHQSIE